MNQSRITRGVVYFLIVIAIVAILWSYNSADPVTSELSISELAAQLKAREVDELRVSGDGQEVTIYYKNRSRQPGRVQLSGVASLMEELNFLGVETTDYQEGDVTIINEKPSQLGSWLSLLSIFLPAIIIIAFVYFIFRQAQGSNNQAISFGKSRARMFSGDHPTVTFEDVAGCDEAKEELREVVEFLRERKVRQLWRAHSRGVLLVAIRTAKRYWPRQSPERPVYPSSASPAQNLWKCSSASARAVSRSLRAAKRHSRALSSL